MEVLAQVAIEELVLVELNLTDLEPPPSAFESAITLEDVVAGEEWPQWPKV
jgi:hypothetical protein